MILQRHLVPKESNRLFRSVFSVHVSQPQSKTGITSDLKIRIFVRLHRYRQCQIVMLTESITPCARPIRRVISWLDPPSLCTTLPRYVKFFQDLNVLASPHAWTHCTVSFSMHLNTWTLVLTQETLSPKPRASPPSAVPLEPLSDPPVTQQRLLHHQQKQDL